MSTNSAINVLKRGKNHPRWREAADFIMERASPEVILLIEAGRQIEREEQLKNQSERPPLIDGSSLLKYLSLIIVTALITGGMAFWLSPELAIC
jgi:hypothetical protein